MLKPQNLVDGIMELFMNRLNAMAKHLDGNNLTLNEIRLMQYIVNYNPSRQRDMAHDLELPASSVSRQLLKFADAGWIQKTPKGWVTTPKADAITKKLHLELLSLFDE